MVLFKFWIYFPVFGCVNLIVHKQKYLTDKLSQVAVSQDVLWIQGFQQKCVLSLKCDNTVAWAELICCLVSRPRCRWVATANGSISVKRWRSPPPSPSPCRWMESPASWHRPSSTSIWGTRPTWCRRPRGGYPCPTSTSTNTPLHCSYSSIQQGFL